MSRMVHPSPGRVVAACLGAAGAAAAPTILLGALALFALPIGFVIALLHVLFLGLPAYLVMRRRWAIDWFHATIAGFVIGAVPLSLWQWLTSIGDPYGSLGISLGVSAMFGALGMLGGAVFRAVLGPPRRQLADREAAAVFE
jgi:hypothetical protein